MSTLRAVIRRLLPPVVLEQWRRARSAQELLAYRHWRVPWTRGYYRYHEAAVASVLAQPEIMHAFRNGLPLPPAYGQGLDERSIEWPWVLANLPPRPGLLLDAGAGMNREFLLDHPTVRQKTVHMVCFAPEKYCFWQQGVSYLFHDLRDLPLREEVYDAVVCLSTLEHIGLDCSVYGQPAEHRLDDFVTVMKELRRVLKPHGVLLLTVPFGVYRNLGTQQVFNENLLRRAVQAFGDARTSYSFFRYTCAGWKTASLTECEASEYVPWVMLPESERSPKFPIQPDGAAAARSVACVRFDS